MTMELKIGQEYLINTGYFCGEKCELIAISANEDCPYQLKLLSTEATGWWPKKDISPILNIGDVFIVQEGVHKGVTVIVTEQTPNVSYVRVKERKKKSTKFCIPKSYLAPALDHPELIVGNYYSHFEKFDKRPLKCTSIYSYGTRGFFEYNPNSTITFSNTEIDLCPNPPEIKKGNGYEIEGQDSKKTFYCWEVSECKNFGTFFINDIQCWVHFTNLTSKAKLDKDTSEIDLAAASASIMDKLLHTPKVETKLKKKENQMETGKRYYLCDYELCRIAHSVSKCGEYGFFTVNEKEIRVHNTNMYYSGEEISCEEKNENMDISPCPTVDELSLTAMETARNEANEYVSSENLIRIELLRSDLKSKTQENMLEVEAIRNGTEQPIHSWWNKVIEVTPTSIFAFTAMIAGVASLGITCANYLM